MTQVDISAFAWPSRAPFEIKTPTEAADRIRRHTAEGEIVEGRSTLESIVRVAKRQVEAIETARPGITASFPDLAELVDATNRAVFALRLGVIEHRERVHGVLDELGEAGAEVASVVLPDICEAGWARWGLLDITVLYTAQN